MSVDLVYQDQFLSTGRTIELTAAQTISVDLESSELGVSLELSVSSAISVELSIVQSLISIELAMTPVSQSAIQLTDPQFTRDQNGLLLRVDYAGGLYKTFDWLNGLLIQETFFNGTSTITKTMTYTNGVLTSINQASSE